MNPLEWSGPQFLMLYMPLLVVTLVAAYVWRSARLGSASVDPVDVQQLRRDPYLVAVLRSRTAAVEAALAALVQAGCLRVEGGRLAVAGPLPEGAAPLERSAYEAVQAGSTRPSTLESVLTPRLESLERELQGQGLLLSAEESAAINRPPLLLVGAVLALGAAKVAVGVVRDRPVAFLVVLLVVCGVFALGLRGAHRLSRRGELALRRLQEELRPLRTSLAAGGASSLLGGTDMALAVGLFGAGALAVGGFDELRTLLDPPSSSGSSSFDSGGSSSDSSSSSSDSGGDGGSSCGGGGCGGCGGGGGD